MTTALPQLKRAGNQQSYAIACNQLGELALKRRDNRAAAEYYGLALDYFTSQGDLYNEATAQRGLYLAQRESDKAAAMRHLERYAALKDTLYNRDAGRTLSEYDARYHNEELRHANAEQRSRQRVVIATALAAIVTLAAIVVILLLLRRIHSRRHRHEREQMEMKDRFFTNITHEFRTPLTVIQLAAEDIGASPDDTRHDVEVIHRQVGRLLTLVGQLLDMAKLRAGDGKAAPTWADTDVVQLTRVAADSMSVMAKDKGVQLKVNAPEQPLRVNVIPDYMQKIVTNLLNNAIKFSQRGGTVTASVRADGNKLRLTVADEGCGMTREQLAHAFEPFYQASDDSHNIGTGIGLALVKLCTDAMHGTVSVESEPGRGTRFDLKFPMTSAMHDGKEVQQAMEESVGSVSPVEEGEPVEPDVAPQDDENITEEPAADKPTVLIVEDNTDVADYTGGLLSDELNVVLATDGVDALEKAHGMIPDIIVADVMMPRMDGMEFCRRVREDTLLGHIPIIMLTAMADDAHRLRGLEAGADAYMTKPFNAHELQLRVRKLLEQRRLLQRKYAQAVEDGDEEQTVDTQADREFLERCAQLVERLVADGTPNVNMLADGMHMGVRQLQRRVGALTGDTPRTYIMRIRIRMAKKLLKQDPSMTMIEVAALCGFDEVSNFARTFKQHTGLTPRQFANGESAAGS